MGMMVRMSASDILSRICPLCKTSNDVIIPVEDHAICRACGTVWELADEKKLGYVCPTHRTNLRAFLDKDGQVSMWCEVCHAYYVIPDTLNRKLKRAFVSLEELG